MFTYQLFLSSVTSSLIWAKIQSEFIERNYSLNTFHLHEIMWNYAKPMNGEVSKIIVHFNPTFSIFKVPFCINALLPFILDQCPIMVPIEVGREPVYTSVFNQNSSAFIFVPCSKVKKLRLGLIGIHRRLSLGYGTQLEMILKISLTGIYILYIFLFLNIHL
jgi:hypothetical protein